jgi:hypothetical protein
VGIPDIILMKFDVRLIFDEVKYLVVMSFISIRRVCNIIIDVNENGH